MCNSVQDTCCCSALHKSLIQSPVLSAGLSTLVKRHTGKRGNQCPPQSGVQQADAQILRERVYHGGECCGPGCLCLADGCPMTGPRPAVDGPPMFVCCSATQHMTTVLHCHGHRLRLLQTDASWNDARYQCLHLKHPSSSRCTVGALQCELACQHVQIHPDQGHGIAPPPCHQRPSLKVQARAAVLRQHAR